MDLEEIREKVLDLLKKPDSKGTLSFSDQELCNLIGETNYVNVYTVLMWLKDEDLILFYHSRNGTNHIGLID